MKIKNFLEENKNIYKNWLEDDDFGGIHIKILKYLEDIDNGFFVECGAHDGVFQSNTKILEDLGWSGLLVEPSDALYDLCKKNRKSIVENYALVSSSFQNNYVDSDTTGTLLKRGKGITLMGEDIDNKCPTITFSELSKKHNINKVDVFFLDVEGYEIEVLKGIDFEEVDIQFFVIEVNYNFFSLSEIDSFMLKKGYENIKNLSNFNPTNCPSWPKNHQDFLYKKIL
jgi:FkbM family methyltransferase